MKKIIQFWASVLAIFLTVTTSAQVRSVSNFNKGWHFTKAKFQPGSKVVSAQWQAVTLPHTWNKDDVMDDAPGYYRAQCWYRKAVVITEAYRNKMVYLYFNGANQQTEVYINGKKAGSHTGGYTRFAVDITPLIQIGKPNEVAVSVDNSYNEDIAPLTADFTFFGGIYRSVHLITVSKTHFSLQHAANGVFVNTPSVSTEDASIHVKGQILNEDAATQDLQLATAVVDKAGKVVSQNAVKLTGSDKEISFAQILPNIKSPHLWSPEDPYLYKVVSKIIDTKTNKVIDQVTNPLGLRWYKFDGEEGFSLNGKHYKLIGASRHQDFKGMGNAIPESYNTRDVKLLKQMGGNFLRVAHYPQDPKVMEACDSLGILASVEIPVVNAITESEAFTDNCKSMLVDMIRQNYNHPSVVVWAYMNEVLLRPKFTDDKPRQKIYFNHVKELAATLDSMTRKEDPSRYTMIACHGDYNRYKQAGIVDVPMLIGWNLYQGWYGGKTEDFAKFLDKFHKDYPALPMLITEYGADADSRIRSSTPERFDKSVDYAVDFHSVYLKAIKDREFVSAGILWNLADFNSEERAETTPHINSKGVLTQDRKAKDVYLYYQANLLKQPFIRFSTWSTRAGIADSASRATSTQPITVYTNANAVQLVLNGKNVGTKQTNDGMVTWEVPLRSGINKVAVTGVNMGRLVTDASQINFKVIPRDLRLAKAPLSINVLLGSKREYLDSKSNVWLPAQPYSAGSFGYVDGKPYKMPGNGRLSYGTDRDILKTAEDPIYQTQQVGIKQFKFDVSAGNYQVVLHFAELVGDKPGASLAYNLSNSEQKETVQERVFTVTANGKQLIKDLNLSRQAGTQTAFSKSYIVSPTGNTGITIGFQPSKGDAVLNAIQLTRL